MEWKTKMTWKTKMASHDTRAKRRQSMAISVKPFTVKPNTLCQKPKVAPAPRCQLSLGCQGQCVLSLGHDGECQGKHEACRDDNPVAERVGESVQRSAYDRIRIECGQWRREYERINLLLRDAYQRIETIEAELGAALEQIKRHRKRLEISPAGDDKIDELEQAFQFLQHRIEIVEAERDAALEREQKAISILTHTVDDIDADDLLELCHRLELNCNPELQKKDG